MHAAHERVFRQQQRGRTLLLCVALLAVHASVLQGVRVRTSTAAAAGARPAGCGASPVAAAHAQRTGPTLLEPRVGHRQRHEPLDGVRQVLPSAFASERQREPAIGLATATAIAYVVSRVTLASGLSSASIVDSLFILSTVY